MNSLDKYMEDEWNSHVAENMGVMISDYMDTKSKDVSEAQKRKDTPVFSGVLKLTFLMQSIKKMFFCRTATNADEPLQWHRDKSGMMDALTRHLLQAGIWIQTE